jgi:hypothetical protein
MFHREPTDYVEISRRLYEGQSIEEIFDRAKKEPHRNNMEFRHPAKPYAESFH